MAHQSSASSSPWTVHDETVRGRLDQPEPGNENPVVDPAEGGSQEVGERMGSLETQLFQLTALVSSLVENQRELVSSLVEQQGEKVESSGCLLYTSPSPRDRG